MDKIKINNKDILIQISEQLKVQYSVIKEEGITQEQADAVERLEISEDCTTLVNNFKNLKKLTVIGKKDTPDLHDITVADLTKLESLNILATKKVKTINLKNLPKVYEMNISGNTSLQQIVGLEEIETLMYLYSIDNKALTKLFDVKKIADNPDIDKIKLDISTIHLLSEQYQNLEEIPDNLNMRNSVRWIEKIDSKRMELGYNEGIQIEKKVEQILGKIIDNSMSDIEKICAINTWLLENVKYDDGVCEDRDEVKAGKKTWGVLAHRSNCMANTSYNSLVAQNAVCEGYTNGMKYLLNKVGIEAETVPCRIWNLNEQRTNFVNSNKANHSIIRFKTKDGWFYSDPTWESEQPDRRKYFFKTKDEMSKIHGLVESEISVESPEERPQKYSNERLSEILTNQRDGIKKSKQPVQQEEYKEQVETKTRTDSNPESFRSKMRFEMTQDQYQEVLDRHVAAEVNFAKEMAENPEKKKTEQVEYDVK